jgi:hypothetical protein
MANQPKANRTFLKVPMFWTILIRLEEQVVELLAFRTGLEHFDLVDKHKIGKPW